MSRHQPKSKKTALSHKEKTGIPAKTSAVFMYWFVAASFILSIAYSNTTLDPAVAIRYLLFCVFVVLFAAWYFFFKKESHPFPKSSFVSLIFLAGLVYCLYSCFAMVFAINARESFMDSSRHFMNLFFLAAVLLMVYYDAGKLIGLCKTLVLLSALHSLIGIFQYYGLAFTELPGNSLPYGLMANRNLYGSAQALLLPFCIHVLLTGTRSWKYVAAFSIVLLFISILLSQTRSAWLASLLILLFAPLLITLFIKKWKRGWLWTTVAMVGLLALMVLLFVFSGSDKKLIQSLRERTRFPAVSVSGYDTTAASSTANQRIVIWNKTLQLIKDHPVAGVGPGNWKIGIQGYGNKGLVNEYGEYVLDRPHNIYLQLAAETGVPGLMLFLLFWILVFIAGFKALQNALLTEDQKLLVILSLCGMAAFGLDGLFSFPLERIEHTFYLFLMAGMVLGYYQLSLPREKRSTVTLKKWYWIPLAFSVLILFISKEKYDFEVHAYHTKALSKTRDYQALIDEVKESETPFGSLDIYGDPLQVYSAIAYEELKRYDLALRECQTALRYHPYNARVYNTLGTIYSETKDFPKAIEAFKKSLSITPRYDISLKNLAVNYYSVQQYAQCLKVLDQVRNVEKDAFLVQIRNACLQQLNK